MKSITALAFILVLLLGDCKNDAKEKVIKGCKDVCCKNASTINLTEALTTCCKEAEECLLPKQLYDVSCMLQIMDWCQKNQANTSAIKQVRTVCCRKDCTCPENNSTTQRKSCTKRLDQIRVKWKEVNFKTKYDLVQEAWKKETWSFFLKMASQKCLKKLPDGGLSVKIWYPYYTNDQSETVFGYESPPAYLAQQKQSFTMFTVVASSFSRMWVTLFLCVTWSLISGVFIWLMDRRANQRQFPSSFWEGVREGAWWALVTMTTVGYGDKTPRSLPARIYSAVWMIFGMIILSMFTAEVTSGLTSKELVPLNAFLGKKVAVPSFGKRHFGEELSGARIIEIKSNESLTKHLLAGTREIERIVFHACEELDANTFEKLQFVRALKKHYVGIRIFTKPRKVGSSLVECVKEMVKEHPRGHESNDKEAPDCEENSKIEITEYGSRKGFDYRDITSIFMYVSIGIVVLMFVAGSAWDFMKTRNLPRRDEGNFGDHGGVEMNAREEQIEIRVIKEDDDGRRSLKGTTTSFNNLAAES